MESESILNSAAFPSPLPQGLTGLFVISYPATGRDAKAVFTNVWGVTTTKDLGASPSPTPLTSLIPATTAAAFGIAAVIWLVVGGLLKTRRASTHE